MTDPLDGLTDAHLQAALDAFDYLATPDEVRKGLSGSPAAHGIIAHARTIAKAEQLEAELAAMREKYEPAPDPLIGEARIIAANARRKTGYPQDAVVLKIEAGEWDDHMLVVAAGNGLRRGIEMQQPPFTQDEAERIARVISQQEYGFIAGVTRALTTPRDELAKMGEG